MPGLNFKGTSKYQEFTDNMLRKTHFTEAEIDRLAELHSHIMVNLRQNLKTLTKTFLF